MVDPAPATVTAATPLATAVAVATAAAVGTATDVNMPSANARGPARKSGAFLFVPTKNPYYCPCRE